MYTAGGSVAFGALDAAAAMTKITPLKPGTSSVTGTPPHAYIPPEKHSKHAASAGPACATSLHFAQLEEAC